MIQLRHLILLGVTVSTVSSVSCKFLHRLLSGISCRFRLCFFSVRILFRHLHPCFSRLCIVHLCTVCIDRIVSDSLEIPWWFVGGYATHCLPKPYATERHFLYTPCRIFVTTPACSHSSLQLKTVLRHMPCNFASSTNSLLSNSSGSNPNKICF